MAVAALRGISQIRVSRALRKAGVPARINSGVSHPSWKGGRNTDAAGYVRVRIERDDPLYVLAGTSGYALEHRVIMSRLLGRLVLDHETVHHIDGDKSNNNPSNLQLRFGRHGKGVALSCADCGGHNIIYRTLK